MEVSLSEQHIFFKGILNLYTISLKCTLVWTITGLCLLQVSHKWDHSWRSFLLFIKIFNRNLKKKFILRSEDHLTVNTYISWQYRGHRTGSKDDNSQFFVPRSNNSLNKQNHHNLRYLYCPVYTVIMSHTLVSKHLGIQLTQLWF